RWKLTGSSFGGSAARALGATSRRRADAPQPIKNEAFMVTSAGVRGGGPSGADGKNRGGGGAEQPFGDAGPEPVGGARWAMRGHHDQADALFLGVIDDHPVGVMAQAHRLDAADAAALAEQGAEPLVIRVLARAGLQQAGGALFLGQVV